MAVLFRDQKGIAFLKITWLDLVKYSECISPVCDSCLTSLVGMDDVILIPILNQAYCLKCGAEGLKRLKRYPEDMEVEERREKFWLDYFGIKEGTAPSEEMTVVIIEPYKQPRIAKIMNNLESMQAVVDGYIEIISADMLFFGHRFKDYLIVLNEEGKLKGLPFNFMIQGDFIAGTVFLCRRDGEELAGLTEEEARMLVDAIRRA